MPASIDQSSCDPLLRACLPLHHLPLYTKLCKTFPIPGQEQSLGYEGLKKFKALSAVLIWSTDFSSKYKQQEDTNARLVTGKQMIWEQEPICLLQARRAASMAKETTGLQHL